MKRTFWQLWGLTAGWAIVFFISGDTRAIWCELLSLLVTFAVCTVLLARELR